MGVAAPMLLAAVAGGGMFKVLHSSARLGTGLGVGASVKKNYQSFGAGTAEMLQFPQERRRYGRRVEFQPLVQVYFLGDI